MELRTAAHTDPGRVRGQNEDAYLTDLPLIAVADGMGGHKAGEIASGLALDVLGSWKARLGSKDATLETLRDAVLAANQTVYERGLEDDDLQGMGTTLTAGWVDAGTVTLAHVGDSRAYLLRGSTLSQITEDQTVVHEMEKEGKLGPGDAARHPHRHILLQAVGSEPDVNVDVTSIELQPGDRLLLSTDGMHGMVADEDRIRDILLAYADPEEACRVLVQAANEAGGEDNITVLILDAVTEGADVVSGDVPVVVSKPTTAHPRRRPSRRTVAIGVGTVTLAGLLVVLVVWRTTQVNYVVATSGDYVALLDGRVGRGLESASGEVVRVWRDVPVQRLSRPAQRRVRTGIEVDSPDEAERVVAALPRVLGPQDIPTPTPEEPPGDATPPPTSTLPPPSPPP